MVARGHTLRDPLHEMEDIKSHCHVGPLPEHVFDGAPKAAGITTVSIHIEKSWRSNASIHVPIHKAIDYAL